MYGISKDRVILLGWVKGKKSHLEVYNDIDIALDTCINQTKKSAKDFHRSNDH